MSDVEYVIACLPCDSMKKLGFPAYQNSTVVNCSRCKCRAWIGPKQKEVADAKGYPIICADCLIKEHGASVLDALRPLTDKKMGD
jgi:hypothetical protein